MGMNLLRKTELVQNEMPCHQDEVLSAPGYVQHCLHMPLASMHRYSEHSTLFEVARKFGTRCGGFAELGSVYVGRKVRQDPATDVVKSAWVLRTCTQKGWTPELVLSPALGGDLHSMCVRKDPRTSAAYFNGLASGNILPNITPH